MNSAPPVSGIRDLDLFKEVLTASCYDRSAWQIVDGSFLDFLGKTGQLTRFENLWLPKAVAALDRRGYVLVKPRPFDAEARQAGNDWPMFGYTMVGHKRLDNIRACIETVLADGVPGDVIETGVWRGGAMMFAKAVLDLNGDTERKVWCADSFEGLPKQYARDLEIASDPELSGLSILAVSRDEVADNFRRFGLLDDRVEFLVGWFKDTLPKAPLGQISVARLDGDLYESTMDALVNIYPKVSDGGFVIIDDYGSWKGCSTAVNEFRDQNGITEPLQQIDMHGWFWRVSK